METPLARWLAVLRRERTDRVPMDYWATDEFTAKLKARLRVPTRKKLFERLHIDAVIKASPRYAGPSRCGGGDEFGRRYRKIDYGAGAYRECVHHPLAGFASVAEIERDYRWPSADWWDFSGIAADLRGWEDYPIRGGGSEPFLVYKDLRGSEQAMMDLIENPDMVHYALDKLFGLAYDVTARIYEAIPGRVLLSYVAEDLGGQTGLMMSARHIEEFLVPRMARMARLAHDAGVFVFHHDDGNCAPIVPRMIEIGIDVLNPLQWRCPGMERERLKAEFGPKVILHGGVDNQWTLPFGTTEDVRREVRDNLRILGAGGGYILAPCHNIQPITPVENVVAMYEEGARSSS